MEKDVKIQLDELKRMAQEALNSATEAISLDVAKSLMGSIKLMTDADAEITLAFSHVKAYEGNKPGDKVYYVYYKSLEKRLYNISLRDFMNRVTVEGEPMGEILKADDDNNVKFPSVIRINSVTAEDTPRYPLSAYKEWSQATWNAHRELHKDKSYDEYRELYIENKTLKPKVNPFLAGFDISAL